MNFEGERMSQKESEIYRQQGFGQKIGIGRRPALLVVDFVNGFNDPELFGGGNIGAAIERTVQLLERCRELMLPVAYSRIVFAEDGSDHNLWCNKIPSLTILTERHPASHVVPALQPRPGELVVPKHNASSFFGTELASWLTMRGIDTLIVTGCTTSGCVRASVMDALCWGFRPIVAVDCVGDRALGPHEASLFDMEQKYADLMPRDEIIAALGGRAR